MLRGHWLTCKAYLSNITVTDFSAFYLQDGGEKVGIDMKQNYITVQVQGKFFSLTETL